MKRLTLVLTFAVLAAVAAPLAAAPRGGGGGRSGGGRSGGGHHGSGRVIVVRPGFGFGFGYGWYSPWYDPYYYGYGYGYGPYYRGYPYGYRGYGYGYGSRGASWAVVDTDVSPEAARVYLDGQYIGTADDFDGYPDYLYLRQGRYRLEFRLEGFQTRTIDVDARPGVKVDIDDKLPRISGAPRYGSYDAPEPRGGVRRFWGKRNNVSVDMTQGDDDSYADGRRGYREPRRDRDDDEYTEERDRHDRDSEMDRREESRRDEWRRGDADERKDTRIVLEIRPDDASVSLDGKFIGKASELDSDGGLAVAPGRHTLVVSKQGYRERRIEVNVSRGETENVEVSLEK
ncbi:MAG TPA: PEGA domain-containing protein [Thermoanaerobaculia bacterium]